MSERGWVKWFDAIKGYGFIRRTDEEDLFVHKKSVAPEFYPLQQNEEVEFAIETGSRGPQACGVVPLQRYQKRWIALKAKELAEQQKKEMEERLARQKYKTALEEELLGHPHPTVERISTKEVMSAAEEYSLPELQATSSDPSADFMISFDSELTEEQVRAGFQALADYYRACGGIGLAVKFEYERVDIRESAHV